MKNKKILMAVMTKPNNIKGTMIIIGVLLVLALIGASITLPKHAQLKQETTLVSYSQKGQFDYTVYLKPSYLYGPAPEVTAPAAQYPLAVVGNIDFTYGFQPTLANASGTVRVEAVLENPGIWQKQLELVPNTATTGDFTINFSLDLRQIAQLFTQIENEAGLSSSYRNLTLNAYYESGSNMQIQSLPVTIENNLIEIPNSLNLTQAAGSGEFNYKVNTILPVAPMSNVKYPAAVVDSLDLTYTFVPVGLEKNTISVQAILQNPGIWQKTFALVSPVVNSGKNTLSFSVSLDQLKQQFDAIDKETGLTTSPRSVIIQATVSSGTDSFVQSLPLILDLDVLQVGGNLQQQQDSGTGSFDYVVNLKPNSIFDTNTLKPPVVLETATLPSFELSGKPPMTTTSLPSVLESGQTAFINLIDKMDVNFGYLFQANKPVENLKTTVDMVATLAVPQSWSKDFTLLNTEKSGDFSLNFPIDLSSYMQLLGSIRSETGVSPDNYNLTITANIHTTGETASGPIDETFNPTMKGMIKGNVLTWDKDLADSKSGAITQTTIVANPNKYLGLSLPAAKILFVILSCVLALILLGAIVVYFRYHGSLLSNFDREAQRIQKKYGTRIAESFSSREIENGEPVYMHSIEDLVKISDELGKPIVHQSGGSSGDIQSYYVIDGDTNYKYSFSKGEDESGEADVTNNS